MGKQGNAIFIPSPGGHGDIAITLGTHEHDCLGNITLCASGATFSLWYKPVEVSVDWGTLFDSTSLRVFYHLNSEDFKMHFHLNNGSHLFRFDSISRVAWHKWYHVGITYSKESGFVVHFDGCTQRKADTIEPYNVTIKNFQLGCVTGNNCPRVHFDDLRFWGVKKSPLFIWALKNM